jgi:hypothetical protein
MDSASRDALLRLILPAVGVVAIYSLWFSKQSQLTAAQAGLEAARAAAVSPMDLMPVRFAISEVNQKQTALEQDKAALDQRWQRMAALPDVNAAKRAAAVKQLTRMLWDRGLYPFHEAPDSTSAQTPDSFNDVVRRLAPNNTSSQPRLWRVQFYGRYSDVAETLASLGELDAPLVPVGLTMSEANLDTGWRLWTLMLWL